MSHSLHAGYSFFTAATAAGSPRDGDRTIPHHAIKPWNHAVGDYPLPSECHERVLDDVVRSVAPLPGKKHQCTGVLIEEPTEDFRINRLHGLLASRVFLLCTMTPRSARFS
jgi:hypothetical protein